MLPKRKRKKKYLGSNSNLKSKLLKVEPSNKQAWSPQTICNMLCNVRVILMCVQDNQLLTELVSFPLYPWSVWRTNWFCVTFMNFFSFCLQLDTFLPLSLGLLFSGFMYSVKLFCSHSVPYPFLKLLLSPYHTLRETYIYRSKKEAIISFTL